nr:ORF1 [Torque teno felis virus]
MFRRRRTRKWRKRSYPRRRRYKRYRRWWRRRRSRRVETFVTENVPKRRRNVWVSGWEPLGNVCNQTTAKMEATPYLSIEKAQTGKFVGTWGKHYLTIQNLLTRSFARWNYWSEDWSSFDYVRYLGATIYILPSQDQNWMINFDPYFQYKKSQFGNEKDKEDLWTHPGILLHTPHTHLIMSQNAFKRRGLYKIRLKPPPGWKGFLRFPEAFDYILMNWVWTWWNPYKCFWNPAENHDTCNATPWWANQNWLAKWVDRSKYQDIALNNEKTWGPFLPQEVRNRRYRILCMVHVQNSFLARGDCIWRPMPRNFINDGMVPPPEGPTIQSSSKKHSQKRKRPVSEADIWPGDLDSDGILKDGAYLRITGDHPPHKRRVLSEQDRLKHLARKLRRILAGRRLLKQ